MRALILASGCVGQPGDQLPECLISLAGRRLIDRQIRALRGGGATEIGVVRGYRGELIDLPDVTYFADDRWASCSTVMSLATAATWLRSGPVIVSAANIFYQAELVHRLGSVRGSLVIAYDRQWREVWTRRFGETAVDIATFRRGASGNLLEIGNKTTKVDEVEGRYVGLLKFTPTAWQAAENLLSGIDASSRDRLGMTTLLQQLLASKLVPIGTVGTDGQCGEINGPDDVAVYESMFAAGQFIMQD